MCFHTNAGQKAKDVELRELRLLHVEKFEMSVVSNCLDCIRMGKGNRMEASCLDLALEGERLCKTGDYRAGVSFFESAIQVGTEDLQILSAIYSQLGNAYFHLQEYNKALEYHRHDLTLTRTIGDELGEAKASGNLGNTLKLLGRYEEALVCCQRHLEITKAIYDKVGQARALYNFGNVYHAKGKGICWSGAEPGEFPEDARTALRNAAQYYEANLCLVTELGDRAAQGRTYGNLGNTYYLLGDFEKAVAAHEKRLLVAKEFGDRSAERRAHCNLGNAHIFLSQFEVAAGHYKRTLQLARLLKDRAVEAQACYSLGNTYTLLQDYERAIDYHLKHLVIAQDLSDRVGEGRAYWSLGNAHTALGNHEQAMFFAEKHLEIAKETGDKSGEVTARMNLSDLRLVVGLKSNSNIHPNIFRNTNANSSALPVSYQGYTNLPGMKSPVRRRSSAEKLKQTPSLDRNQTGDSPAHPDWEEDTFPGSSKNNTIKASTKLFLFHRLKSKKHKSNKSPPKDQQENCSEHKAPELDTPVSIKPGPRDTIGEDGFFDLLSRFQGNRMDDQRCSLLDGPSHLPAHSSPSSTPPVAARKSISACETPSQDPSHFLELLASSQARRLDDQRVSLSHFPGLRLSTSSPPHTPSTSNADQVPTKATISSTDSPHTPSLYSQLEASDEQPEGDDVFFDMLVKCQGSRLNDQRCAAPPSSSPPSPTKGPTVPDEDFFSLILRSQSNRMEEQRVQPPPSVTQTKLD
ncbi:G-protein-signaling modulator 2-like isoform X1 [Scophthalmus maximus]|uniref:G-protein-signaling modulator 2-like isoform X1 n=2 Tax=Scophthalmus maximus TaxID=52904 RepID=UPI0015E0FED2|nr:G-protein-signaling modulator 2-like isoform X1 [Scophthalmus maximus]XP_047192729.1 G-protein-signaling modulator 2-like isoform X1 [Scophthalmus maximus]